MLHSLMHRSLWFFDELIAHAARAGASSDVSSCWRLQKGYWLCNFSLQIPGANWKQCLERILQAFFSCKGRCLSYLCASIVLLRQTNVSELELVQLQHFCKSCGTWLLFYLFIFFAVKNHHLHHHHHSRKGPGHSVAPMLGQLISTNITHSLEEPALTRKYPAPEASEEGTRSRAYSSKQPGKLHCICENDSKSATGSSGNSNESHTSGYQTDDGTFEGKMLRHATRSKPANIRMTALKDYSPCCSEELVLRRGQRVKVLYKKNDWVYAITKTGEAGYVPYNFVRPSRKYCGYQSEGEYAGETDYCQSGYDTDAPASGQTRYGARTQIGDVPAYSIHTHTTAFRGSPEEHLSQRHGSTGSYNRSAPRHTNGYASAVEYPPTSPDSSRHPRPAKSLHSLVDSNVSPTGMDRRPTVGKPGVDTFSLGFLEDLVVIHDFEAHEEDEVFISKGEQVKVLNAEDPFWLWIETMPGVAGFVPRSCCALGNHPCKY